jgi:hypothetical protein
MDGCLEDHMPWTCHDVIYKVFAESGSDYDDSNESRNKGASKAHVCQARRVRLCQQCWPSEVAKHAMKFDATSASTAVGANEVQDIEPLSTAFGKIVNDGAHARREEKERKHEATARRDRWGSRRRH